jgi:hypothetical protein
MLSTWLRCDTCGTQTRDEGLCPGCGAHRGRGVPLPECEPDGVWIHEIRGGSEQALKALGRAVSSAPGPHAQARLAVVRRVLAAFPSSGQVLIRLDLRGAETGALHLQRRRGNSRETFHRLPWLWMRGVDLEASVTRTLHRKVVRTFRSGVESSATRFELDELRVQTSQGGLRRPFRRPSSLTGLGPQDLEASVPGLDEPLSPSAPGVGGEPPRGAALGLVAAAALLILGPLFLSPSGTVSPLADDLDEPALARAAALAGDSTAASDLGLAPRAVLKGLAADDSHQRRLALSHLEALHPAERWRALVVAARDPVPDVRERALEELSRTPLGVAALAERCGPAAPLETRIRAFELLRRADPSRARALALAALPSSAPDRLRRAWALSLGDLCPVGDWAATTALSLVVREKAPDQAAAAATSLARVSPQALLPLLPAALERAADLEDHRALVTLARALRAAGGDLSVLERLLATRESLSPRARRRLRALAR